MTSEYNAPVPGECISLSRFNVVQRTLTCSLPSLADYLKVNTSVTAITAVI